MALSFRPLSHPDERDQTADDDTDPAEDLNEVGRRARVGPGKDCDQLRRDALKRNKVDTKRPASERAVHVHPHLGRIVEERLVGLFQ